MDIKELRKQPHLSASGVNAYVECGLQYKFSRVDHLIPEFRTDVLEFGSCIHKALADFNQERMQGKTPGIKDLEESFEEHWNCIGENVQYAKGRSFEDMLEEGKDLLQASYGHLIEDPFQIIAIEEPFVFQMDGLPVPLIGVMDLVCEDADGTIIIIDYKTTSRAYSGREANGNFQLTVYHMAAKANGYAGREILLRLDCLVKTRTPKFEQHYTTRTRKDESRVLRKIQTVWQGIQAGIFVPNDASWKCNNCAYKQACNQWLEGGE
ncbi:RecB family exonuclease [Desulfatibacillum aliphaticivorans]|uniref:RecB family exonuclease n=1 Tax=Desulfatibacillum aliphaticivorans TaxID=218208 RepID=UPI0004035BF4|nr:PD-(D/E)XK nuclease family protein [Desulfatibacillum aliphaticivorans]